MIWVMRSIEVRPKPHETVRKAESDIKNTSETEAEAEPELKTKAKQEPKP